MLHFNIFRAPQGPWQSSQKYFPLWSAWLHSLIGSGGITTAVSVDIMVSDIKGTLTRVHSPFQSLFIVDSKNLGYRLTLSIIHLQTWGYTPKANLEVLFEAFSRLTYFYLTVSNRFWSHLTKWPSWSHQNSRFSTWWPKLSPPSILLLRWGYFCLITALKPIVWVHNEWGLERWLLISETIIFTETAVVIPPDPISEWSDQIIGGNIIGMTTRGPGELWKCLKWSILIFPN